MPKRATAEPPSGTAALLDENENVTTALICRERPCAGRVVEACNHQSAHSVKVKLVMSLVIDRERFEIERVGRSSKHECPKRRDRRRERIEAERVHRDASANWDSAVVTSHADSKNARKRGEGVRGVYVPGIGRVGAVERNSAANRGRLSLRAESEKRDRDGGASN